MSLNERINHDMKAAMKEKAGLKLSVLRQLVAATFNEAIALGKKAEGLDDSEYLKVIRRETRKRQDAISQYEQAGRDELAVQEKQELEVLETYLPEQISEDDVRKFVGNVMSELGVSGTGDFGRVMGAVMKLVSGRADGKVVSRLVQEALKSKS